MSNTTRTGVWSTSAHGGTTEPTPIELAALKKQLDECCGARGRVFRLQCMAETMKRVVAKHLVTSVFIILFLLVVGSLVAKA